MPDPHFQQTDVSSNRPSDVLLTVAIERARTGDEDAFRLVYRAVQPRLLNYLRAMVGETDAEDIASETWARVARDIRSFTGDADGFRGWTTTIARHRAIDQLRRRRPTLPLEEIGQRPATDDTEQAATDSLSTTAALALIAQLPQEQAQAILLRVVIGLDAASAGRILDKKPGAIRTAAHRGLRSLAGRLREPVPSGNTV